MVHLALVIPNPLLFPLCYVPMNDYLQNKNKTESNGVCRKMAVAPHRIREEGF